MTKAAIAAIFSMLVCSATTAAAGNPSLCTKDGWAIAQSSLGQTFASQKECTKAREVYRPTLSISPAHVAAEERFTITGTGFHANSHVTVYFAITGQSAPFTFIDPPTNTLADGSYSLPIVFAQCGNSPDDLTLTLVDAYGVQASARLVLC